MRLFLLSLSAFLAGCSHELLSVRTEYLTPSYLASTRVDTPDPLRPCFYGQQLVIHYHLPPECFSNDTRILLSIRYGTGCVETFSYPLQKSGGYIIHRLVKEDYWDTGGIFSYKVELMEGDELLGFKEHHLWVELIDL